MPLSADKSARGAWGDASDDDALLTWRPVPRALLPQVLTGDSWSEVLARPLLFGWSEYGSASVFLAAFFFISFVLVNTFILFNVFVAVLLDKMMGQGPQDESHDNLVDLLEEFGVDEEDASEGEAKPAEARAADGKEAKRASLSGDVETTTGKGGATEHAALAQALRAVMSELHSIKESVRRLEAHAGLEEPAEPPLAKGSSQSSTKLQLLPGRTARVMPFGGGEAISEGKSATLGPLMPEDEIIEDDL